MTSSIKYILGAPMGVLNLSYSDKVIAAVIGHKDATTRLNIFRHWVESEHPNILEAMMELLVQEAEKREKIDDYKVVLKLVHTTNEILQDIITLHDNEQS